MMHPRQRQRVVAWQVYDYTLKMYYAGDSTPGHPTWTPYKQYAYRCRDFDEAEELVLRVPPKHERRVLEVKARSY